MRSPVFNHCRTKRRTDNATCAQGDTETKCMLELQRQELAKNQDRFLTSGISAVPSSGVSIKLKPEKLNRQSTDVRCSDGSPCVAASSHSSDATADARTSVSRCFDGSPCVAAASHSLDAVSCTVDAGHRIPAAARHSAASSPRAPVNTTHVITPTQLGIILWYYTLIGLLCCEAFEHKYLTLKSSFARTASHQFVCQSLQDATPTAVTALYI